MRRGEFMAYLEAQAAGYTGTFDEWEYDQYPRLQPPGFGAADHDEVCSHIRMDEHLCEAGLSSCSGGETQEGRTCTAMEDLSMPL